MNEIHQNVLNNVREKSLNFDLNHPIKRSSNVAFRDIFDPYCAEYKRIDHETRMAILREMLTTGMITSVISLYSAFVAMFEERRPDIANAAADGLATLLEHALFTD